MRRKSQPRYNGPNIPPGGFGRRPGQYENRKWTMLEEILRGPSIVSAILLCLGTIGVFLYFNLSLLGPMVGVLAVLVVIVLAANWIVRLGNAHGRKTVIVTLILVVSVWLYIGYDLCLSIWPPAILVRWNTILKAIIVIGLIAAKVFLSLCIVTLVKELLDPNWPPPRNAISRDTAMGLRPVETYGGQILPSNQLSSPSSSTIRVEIVEENGSIKYIDGIPDTPEWHRFSKYISSKGPRSFTENAAKGFKIKLLDQVIGGVLIVKGMRTVRTELLDRGLAYWHSADHGRGVVLKRPAMLMFEAIGERS